jgi:hypothetical protein
MQRENPTTDAGFVDPRADEPPEAADDGPLPHAAASRARAAVAMMAAVVRITRVLSFIVSSPGLHEPLRSVRSAAPRTQV